MRKIATSKGLWTINGLEMIPSDSIYQAIKTAIENDLLVEEYLQKVTGHLAPISIDCVTKTITFQRS